MSETVHAQGRHADTAVKTGKCLVDQLAKRWLMYNNMTEIISNSAIPQ